LHGKECAERGAGVRGAERGVSGVSGGVGRCKWRLSDVYLIRSTPAIPSRLAMATKNCLPHRAGVATSLIQTRTRQDCGPMKLIPQRKVIWKIGEPSNGNCIFTWEFRQVPPYNLQVMRDIFISFGLAFLFGDREYGKYGINFICILF